MLSLFDPSRVKRIVCLGAHSDDIEIGCGGTLLRLAQQCPGLHVHWVVFGGAREDRAKEARDSADRFLDGVRSKQVIVAGFRDAYMPYEGAAVKDFFERELKDARPDLVLTHFRDDRHQDHRLISDLAWNTWRDHLVLEYEIPKYDGDLGRPNCYAPLPHELCERKVKLLMAGFPTQAGRHWFTDDTFWSLLRLRGVECNSPTKYAEAFHARKLVL